ncbi:MAG: hypothetical protein ACYDAR_03555 [Thermomicrobiales bacterium]
MQRRFRVRPALLIFALLLTLVAVAPQAVGASGLQVQFTVNPGGQKALTLLGNGFAPGENVTIVGFTNDNQTAYFPDTTADAIGAFSVQIYYQPSVYRIQVTGQLTGIRVVADVGAGTGTPPGFVPPYPTPPLCRAFGTGFFFICPTAPLFGPGYVPIATTTTVPAPPPMLPPAPAPGANTTTVGQSVTFSISGFTANETVAAWVTAPDASVTPIGSTQAADGSITIVISFPSAGNWQVTAHGQSSGIEVVTGYTVS